jgi:predicted nucleotidyltransferase
MGFKIKTIEDLKEFLKDYFKEKNVKVYLFGSRAYCNNSPYSDVDIAIDTEEDIAKDLALLRYLVEESVLPYKVDFVDLKMAPHLKPIVYEKGQRWL